MYTQGFYLYCHFFHYYYYFNVLVVAYKYYGTVCFYDVTPRAPRLLFFKDHRPSARVYDGIYEEILSRDIKATQIYSVEISASDDPATSVTYFW